MVGLIYSSCSNHICGSETISYFLVNLVFAAIGAGADYIVDSIVGSNEVTIVGSTTSAVASEKSLSCSLIFAWWSMIAVWLVGL